MNQPPNPLDIPEILSRVGLYIPLWVHSDHTTRVRGLRPRYAPQHLLNCILVNKTWHDILLPILWFTMDDISIPSIPNAVNILSRHSSRLRILELSHSVPEILSIPLTLLPRNLIHLDLSGYDHNQWAQALVLQNPRLQSLRWQGGDFHRDNYGTLDALALSKQLNRLQDLRLECWKLDGSFITLLKNNPMLKKISLDFVTGEINTHDVDYTISNDSKDYNNNNNNNITLRDRTLPSLSLSSLSSPSHRIHVEKREYSNGNCINIEEPEVILPHLTSLAVCKDMESGALEALVRHCPALEELSWMGSNDGDLKDLTTNLKECCPSLSSLTYSTVEVLENESVYAELIQSVNHLVELQIKIPALGDAFTDALIKHAHTLEILDIRITGQHVNCDRNLERILKRCHQITALSIEGTKCGATNLFTFNWACQRLNRLFLTGLHSITYEPQMNEDCESVAANYGWAASPLGSNGGRGGGNGSGGGEEGESRDDTESESLDHTMPPVVTMIDGVIHVSPSRASVERPAMICTRFLKSLLLHLQTLSDLQFFVLNGVEYSRMVNMDCHEI